MSDCQPDGQLLFLTVSSWLQVNALIVPNADYGLVPLFCRSFLLECSLDHFCNDRFARFFSVEDRTISLLGCEFVTFESLIGDTSDSGGVRFCTKDVVSNSVNEHRRDYVSL